MFEDSKIFNFFKTAKLLEELMHIHLFLCCSLQVQDFEMVSSQTKMCYQMSKAHNFRHNFCICSEQEVQLEISRLIMKILKILKFVLLFSVSILYIFFVIAFVYSRSADIPSSSSM